MKKNITSSIGLILLVNIIVHAQHFRRIEVQADLGHLANTNGVAVADYDLDNDLDILIIGEEAFSSNIPTTYIRLLRNKNDGSFEDVTTSSNIEQAFFHEITGLQGFDLGDKMAVSWGDYDNDGYPDLFISAAVQSQLYHNNGDGTFTNVTVAAGIEDYCDSCYHSGATWWDFDNDGDLDLYVTDYNFISDNKLYENDGDGTFTLNNALNFVIDANSLSSIPIDVNGDHLLDLYVANDFDQNNFLFVNQGNGTFTEEAVSYGLGDPFDGMGLSTCDFNNDGRFDVLITNIKENGFYVQSGNGSYSQQAQALGIYDTDWSWGSMFADVNLDGYEDLYILNGFVNEETNDFFLNVPEGNSRGFLATNLTETTNANSNSRSVVPFDFDNDGDEDVIVSNFSHQVLFYENRSVDSYFTNEIAGNWLKVKLEGTVSNRYAIGSKVELHTDNQLEQYRLFHGSGYQSQSIKPIHFGLGDASMVTSISVTWPTGITETFNSININQTIKIIEGSGLIVENDNTSVKLPGCTDQNACNYDEFATVDDGSCSFLESGTISGNTVVFPLDEEVYSYAPSAGNIYEWSVMNGEIVDGQGTANVTIHWNVATQGQITLVNRNEQCATEAITLDVTIEEPDLGNGQHSIARLWNELLLEAIRNDFARPTVHARNLFHTSIAMYDAWAIYDDEATPYFLGNTVHGFTTALNAFETNEPLNISRSKTLSYAVYRLLKHRFGNSPNAEETLQSFDDLMTLLDYDINNNSLDYSSGDPAALGNYLGQKIIDYGMQDGSNESGSYDNLYYEPVNDPLVPDLPGNPDIVDPNRWQPLSLNVFIDQSGNILEETTPEFLSPEWGNSLPFSLTEEQLSTYTRDGNTYKVFHDPGKPPYIGTNEEESDIYKWGFTMVTVWQSHLDPNDGVLWDISPRSLGNISSSTFPTDFSDYSDFYDYFEGGDTSNGYSINPITGQPYEVQMVPRGDYARVLAEFWADGPDSETPPGHWFTILNYVNDHPQLQKRFAGEGEVLDNLEWDVKTYFTLGGAMHDSAIAAWGIKGWYDYLRPISAIRYMAEKGQSTDESLANYHPDGIPLIDGFIEVVNADDPLVDDHPDNEGKIKLYTWRGHDYISDTETDMAGVGWILAENWWPYQRPSFVTPPFAGYISGHSTFSRAAAEALTRLTGTPYFPGGLGEFVARENEFLVFEEGPSQDIVLQWATYRDASDQTSLSRIWGGIHPPMDDIPGRLIGEQIGNEAFEEAEIYFNGGVVSPPEVSEMKLFPNPVDNFKSITITNTSQDTQFLLFDVSGKLIQISPEYHDNSEMTSIYIGDLANGIYFLRAGNESFKVMVK